MVESATIACNKALAQESMKTTTTAVRQIGTTDLTYVWHPTFDTGTTYEEPGPAPANGFMRQAATEQWSKAMHYAGHQWAMAQRDRTQGAGKTALWKDRYETARNAMVQGNYKLIYGVMNAMHLSPAAQDEHRDVAEDALMNAAQKYNPWFAVRFNTYATRAIRNALVQRLTRPDLKAGPRNRVSIHDLEKSTDDALCDKRIANRCASIGDFLRMYGLEESMTPREQQVLQSYFFEERSPNRADIAAEMALDPRLVSKIKHRSLTKLRSALRARNMDAEDLLN